MLVVAAWRRLESEDVMKRGGLRWAVTPLVAGAVTLGACTTGGGEVSPTPPAVTTSSSPTLSSAASTTTALTDDEAAIAAVREFSRQFDLALKSRATTEFRKTFTDGCRVCKEDAAVIDQAALAGRTFETGSSELSNVIITSRPDPSRWLVSAHLVSPRLTIRDATGKVVSDSPSETSTKQFIVLKRADAWLVEGVTRG